MPRAFFPSLFILLALLLLSPAANAQVPGAPTTLLDAKPVDTASRTNTNEWENETVRITFRTASSAVNAIPDTSIHLLHRRRFSQLNERDLGNQGSAMRYRLFHPDAEGRTGLALGYNAYDAYRINADSVLYYNTTRPFTQFGYQLGSKLEQIAQVMHTQNILPDWNFAFSYRKLTSPGYYKIQRTNHDNASLTSNYKSSNQRYELKAALVYNKEQQDENGGITADSFLTNPDYSDKSVIPVLYQNDGYSARRSPMINTLRDVTFLLQHGYTLGQVDTLYNADSTEYNIKLTPRFRIGHRLDAGSQRHLFNHLQPDSVDYLSFGNYSLLTTDSVYSRQSHFWLDNKVQLSGYLGTAERQLGFSVGAGIRLDQFRSEYVTDNIRENNWSNYITGELSKEALRRGQWFYGAAAQLYATGPAAGNFLLNARLGKDLGEQWGVVEAGFRQTLRQAPYIYRQYRTNYFEQINSLSNESITTLYATANVSRLRLSVGVRAYLLGNYIYMASPNGNVTSGQLEVRQNSGAFNLNQIWLRKIFRFGSFVADNEFTLQQVTGNGPVNVPLALGRHQLSYEAYLFKKKLQVATGVEVRYHSPYEADGYSAIYNRFYYQNSYSLGNDPEGSAFFNFRVKRFRAYIMADQVQQLFLSNMITAPFYPGQDFMVRFGFEWALVN